MMNGRNIISGSEDGTCNLWDIRQGTCLATIAAHKNSLTSLFLYERSGFFVTSGTDSFCKIWSLQFFKYKTMILCTRNKVLSSSISSNGTYVTIITISDEGNLRF